MGKDSYSPLGELLELGESEVHGVGVFAKVDIPEGTNLGESHYFIIVDEKPQTVRTPLGGYYNHSKEPNTKRISRFAYWNKLDIGKRMFKISELVTIRDIRKGEEILVEYSMYKPGKD